MKINFLDHVAIRVSNMEQSVLWYQNVLGLEQFNDAKNWGEYPHIMLSGKSGIALFPKKADDDLTYVTARMHFAFNVDRDSFQAFQHAFEQKGIEFSFENHHHFHSIYIKDPDDYTIELTTPVGES